MSKCLQFKYNAVDAAINSIQIVHLDQSCLNDI